MFLCVLACETTDPPTVICPPPPEEIPDPRIPTADACDGQVLLDATLTRRAGAPQVEEIALSIPRDASACVEVRSPATEVGTPTASVWVRLDDETVVEPRDLSHQPTVFRERLALAAGSHTLRVSQRSAPGATLRITIRIASTDSSAALAQARRLAALRYESCAEMNRVLESLPLEARSAVVENLSAAGFQPGQLVVEGNVWGVPSLLTPLPAEDLGAAVTPEERALAWLELHREVFRLDDPDIAFEARPAASLPDGAHRVELRARWRGLRIEGVGLTVLLDGSDQVRSVAGEVVPHVAVPATPVITSAEAMMIAGAATGSVATEEPLLEVLNLGLLRAEARTTLAWAVPTDVAFVRVDGITGEVLNVTRPPGGGFLLVEHAPDSATVGGVETDLSMTVRFNSSEDPYLRSGPCIAGDATCEALFFSVAAVELFHREGLGRRGWSDDGNGADIPADAPYRIVYNSQNTQVLDRLGTFDRTGVFSGGLTLLARNERGDVVATEDVTLAPTVALAPNNHNEDIVAHEFGHGVFAVDFSGDRGGTATCPFQRVDESVADTLAMFEDAFYRRSLEEQLTLRDARGFLVRDHGHSDPPAVADLGDCTGHRHLTQLDPQPATFDAPCFEHANSCILTKLWALSREAAETGATVSYHGVDVAPIPFDETKPVFVDLVRSFLSTGTDVIPYGRSYLQAVAARSMLCGLLAACPDDYVSRLTAPMWAVGLWSPQQPLGLGHDSVVGPATAARDGSVWVFFAPPPGPAGAVHVYRDADALDTTPGDAVPLSDLGVVLPLTQSDLAAARTGDLVSVALIPEGGGSVAFASTLSTTDATWDPAVSIVAVPDVREDVGSLTLAHVGAPDGPAATEGRLFVVEIVNPIDRVSELVYFTDLDPTVRPIPGARNHSSPALARNPSGGLELWAETGGSLVYFEVTDPLTSDVTWDRVEVIPVTGGRGRLFPSFGIAVAAHLTRTQVFARRFTGVVAHHARGAQVGGFIDVSTSNRRPALFGQTAPDGRPAQVLVGVGNGVDRPDALMLRYHESD